MLWDLKSGKMKALLKGHVGPIHGLAMSPDDRYLASISADGTARVWELATLQTKLVVEHPQSSFRCAVFSPNGKRLAIGCANKDPKIKELSGQAIQLWDILAGKLVVSLNGHKDDITCLAYSPDGKTLASASMDRDIKTWDPERAEVINTLTGHTRAVTCLGYSPDGTNLASVSWDGTLRMWNTKDGHNKYTLKSDYGSILCLAYHCLGRIVALGSESGEVELWDGLNGNARLLA